MVIYNFLEVGFAEVVFVKCTDDITSFWIKVMVLFKFEFVLMYKGRNLTQSSTTVEFIPFF